MLARPTACEGAAGAYARPAEIDFCHTVRFWDVRTGQALGTNLVHSLPVYCMALSHDGKTIATGSGTPIFAKPPTGRITLWDVRTREKLHTITRDHRIWSVSFSPDDKLVMSGEADRSMRLWETATAKAVGEPWFHAGQVNSAAFSPDGLTVASGGAHSTAQLWKIKLP